MLFGKDDLGEVFDSIHNVWIQTGTTVIILCAADCDSICTTKILTVKHQRFCNIIDDQKYKFMFDSTYSRYSRQR